MFQKGEKKTKKKLNHGVAIQEITFVHSRTPWRYGNKSIILIIDLFCRILSLL